MPEVGVIGGSGLYSLLEEATEVVVETPYGEPSDSVLVGRAGGRCGPVATRTAVRTGTRKRSGRRTDAPARPSVLVE